MTKVFKYVLKYKGTLIWGTISMLIVIGVDLLIPYMQQIFIDDGIIAGNKNSIIFVLGAILSISIIKAIFGYNKEFKYDLLSAWVHEDIEIDENKIKFKDIDKSNYNECISLKVGESQKNYVASNMYSLVQASYEDELYPLGIFNEDEMVGFLLYDYDKELNGWSFSRFMIDIKYQNKGLGRMALKKFLEYFHNRFPDESLYTSVEIDNDIAIKLYQKYGFEIKSSFEYTIEDVIYKEFRMIKEIW